MHLNCCNVILITTICLIFLIEAAWLKTDNNETFPAKNGAHRCSRDLKKNITNISEEEKYVPGIKNFLSSEPAFGTNEGAIDILKMFISSNEDKENKTTSGNKNEHHFENNFTRRNSTYARKISNNNTEAKQNPIQREQDLIKPNIFEINNENALDILKASASSLLAKKNTSEVKEYKERPTTTKSVSPDFGDGALTVSNITETKLEDESTSSDIILSEITNLSRENEEETSLGQKIEFQRSSIDIEEGVSNKAGKEILQNTTRVCGYVLGKRVSFAEPTTLMEFPWTALLLYNTNIRYHCGGSLITTKYVLTAAHCVAQEFYELTGVRLGEHDISEAKDCAPDVGGSEICAVKVDAQVLKIIIHHDYSHRSFKNDIALLRLDDEYLGRSFYPICLPTPEMIYGDKMATVAGWGATEKAIRSTLLLKATVPIFDISKCREIYRYKVFNDSTEICASGQNEVDVCKGDSGGAIFYNENVSGRDKFFQLGIISLGVRRCGDKRFLPAIFTKLNGFYKWIENNLEY